MVIGIASCLEFNVPFGWVLEGWEHNDLLDSKFDILFKKRRFEAVHLLGFFFQKK